MFAARAKRVRPHLDDKVLASWNGMMLGALARAYAVLGDPEYRARRGKEPGLPAAATCGSVQQNAYITAGAQGERDSVQLLTAYANLCAGAIDLYEATLEPEHLDFAVALAETMLAKFYDPQQGGFYDSAGETPDLILRMKEDYDGAEPSGNSAAVLALLRLASDYGAQGVQGRGGKDAAAAFAAPARPAPGGAESLDGFGLPLARAIAGRPGGRSASAGNGGVAPRHPRRLSAEQSGHGQLRRSGSICKNVARQGYADSLPLHRHSLPAADARTSPPCNAPWARWSSRCRPAKSASWPGA